MKPIIGSAITVAAVIATLAAASQQASPEVVTFTAVLSPANEVPPVTNAESKGSGEVTVTFKITRDASKTITGATADFNVTLSGFPAETPITAAHIHRGAAGANGGPVVNLALAAGSVTLPNGSGKFMKAGLTVTPAVAQEILSGPAGFYFNVHTMMNPGGVARGQLAPKK